MTEFVEFRRERHNDPVQDGIEQIAEGIRIQHALEMENIELREKQKQLEAALAKYSDIYESAPVGYLTLDDKGHVRDLNRAAARQLSKSCEQLLGRPFTFFLTISSGREFLRVLNQTIESGGEHSVELRIIKGAEYSPQYVCMHLVRSNNGNGERLVRSTFLDVSAKHRAELALRESEARYRSLVDLSPSAVVVHDLDGRILFANHTAAQLTGSAFVEQLVGKSVYDFVHPDARHQVTQLIELMNKEQRPISTIEQKLITLNRGVLNVEVTGGPLMYNNQQAIQVMVRDITERKHAEVKTLELLQQNRSLTKRMFQVQEEERQHLARELHDEFGQWLTAIQLDTQNIANLLTDKSGQIEDSIASITHSAQQIQNNIRRLNRNLRPALLDELGLSDSLQELVNQWQLHNPNIQCQFTVDSDIRNLDDNLSISIYRLVQEGLTNVSKHAGASEVRITLELESAHPHARMLLSIEDNGKGLKQHSGEIGFGLLGMRERVRALGGKFQMSDCCSGDCCHGENYEKTGLKITAELPVID